MKTKPKANSKKLAQILKGKRVVLRLFKEEDLVLFKERPPDDEFRRMVGGDRNERPMTFEERKKEFKKHQKDRSRQDFAILTKDGRLVGHCFFHHINQKDRRAAYAIGINAKSFRGKGLGTEATKLMLKYGFVTLGLHRIDLRVLEYNQAAIRCYQKCGFKEEGKERESGLVDGKWYDDVRMSILEQEWREMKSR